MLALIRTGGYEPRVVPSPLHYSAATHMVALGAGWILTVNSVAEIPPIGCVALPIEDARLDLGFYVLRRQDDDRPAITELISILRDVVQGTGAAP
jgi:DNA-binding transcriptional LysR family regulator